MAYIHVHVHVHVYFRMIKCNTILYLHVHCIIKLIYKIVLMQDHDKRTPMHAAAYVGDTESINALIQAGMFKRETDHLLT